MLGNSQGFTQHARFTVVYSCGNSEFLIFRKVNYSILELTSCYLFSFSLSFTGYFLNYHGNTTEVLNELCFFYLPTFLR